MEVNNAKRIVIEAGFKPPLVTYTKPDPRGSEYGHFIVTILDDETVEVTKCNVDAQGKDDGEASYNMTMSLRSFRRWAEECT